MKVKELIQELQKHDPEWIVTQTAKIFESYEDWLDGKQIDGHCETKSISVSDGSCYKSGMNMEIKEKHVNLQSE